MTPLIYNLFPRLVGPMSRWPDHARRAADMAFNWLYVNPWYLPGFSGSIYAPKDFERVNPLFLSPGETGDGLETLRGTLAEVRAAGLRPMMDLVVNHTSRDARLTAQHPEWYRRDEKGDLVSPSVRDPDDPNQITVWGDLAEVDNESPDDREGLWEYWSDLVGSSVRLGFGGFRCDAAYKVPSELWRRLIQEARRVDPSIEFFAETLGAPIESVLALRDAGFDYIFNSSKWWDFQQPWALDQHERFRAVAPSISFPESHDTARLAAESGGSERVQRQRYAFAAAFSAGVMMPIGYEFGFSRALDVVHSMPADWERKAFDLSGFIANVNRLKLGRPLLSGEGILGAPSGLHDDVLVLERRSERAELAGRRALIIVNTLRDERRDLTLGERAGPADALFRVCRDDFSGQGEPVPDRLMLEPAEVVYVLPG